MADVDIEALARQVDRLTSIESIRGLISAYCAACDEHDMPRLMSLFTDDAAFDAPNGAMVADGKAAIEEMFINTFKIRGPSYHWTHDVTIDIDEDGNGASGVVMAHAETCPSGVMSIAAMRYYDRYRREAGQWRFASRSIHFLYYVPFTEYGSVLTTTNRVVMGTERHPADVPEALAAWRQFIDTHGPLQI